MRNLIRRIDWRQYNLLYILFLIMPFVDMLTGALLNAGYDHFLTKIGQVYRIVFLLYLAYTIYWENRFHNVKWLFGFSVYLMVLVAVYRIRFGSSIAENASYAVKLLFPLYLICGLRCKMTAEKLNAVKVFDLYAWIYPLSILVPKFLGLGYYNYSYANLDVDIADSGFKGFYYSSNEVNVILVALFIYSFGKFFKKPSLSSGIEAALQIGALLLMGTKTSLLAIPLVILGFLLLQGDRRRHLKWTLLALGGAAMILTVMVLLLQDLFAGVAERFLHQYELYADTPGGLLTFLCSERNLRILPAVEYWFIEDPLGIVNLLFGIGKAEKCPNDSPYGLHSIIEMDFFDGLFWFGLIAISVVVFFYLRVWIRSLKVKGAFPEKLAFIVMLAFSMIAGHVFMSACAGTMLGLLGAVLSSHQEKS